jgi:hypothetical protein
MFGFGLPVPQSDRGIACTRFKHRLRMFSLRRMLAHRENEKLVAHQPRNTSNEG